MRWGCCLQVLSPLPTFINNGAFRAWADAGGSPLIFVMRCNPQHYYLLHEMGHRLGMPHAVLYKLAEETATATVSMLGRTLSVQTQLQWPGGELPNTPKCPAGAPAETTAVPSPKA
jgi:hypothetical protein